MSKRFPALRQRYYGSPTDVSAYKTRSYPLKEDKRPYKIEFPKGSGNSHSVAIVVPATKNVDTPVGASEHRRRVAKVQKFLSRMCGGGTNFAGFGTYYTKSPSKKNRRYTGAYVAEPATKVEVACSRKDYARFDKRLEDFLHYKKKKWGQESLSLTYKGKMFLV